MTTCINDISKIYTGLELSPLGLGYSPDPEFTGKIMNGKDGNYYIIKDEIKHKKWEILDIDLNKLPIDCYSEAKIPITKKIDPSEENELDEKFGGTKPFFVKGDRWPINHDDNIPMVFFGQFKHPFKDNTLLQLFVDINNYHSPNELSYINEIELNLENISKQIIIPKPTCNYDIELTTFDTYLITGYETRKELKPIHFIYERLSIPQNDNFEEKYNNHIEFYPSDGLKIGGTARYCQYPYYGINKYLQISNCKELPYDWGDSGIAHIIDAKFEGYYDVQWDCC